MPAKIIQFPIPAEARERLQAKMDAEGPLATPVAEIAPESPAAAPVAPVSESDKEPPVARFEVGKEYYVRSLCDHDCIYRFTVVARTAKQVTLRSKGETKTVKRGVTVCRNGYRNEELCMPHGRYSMAACLGASHVVPEDGVIP